MIKVITFDLDNTLWDVEPALLRAEQAQQEWLQQHRPGAWKPTITRPVGIQEVRVAAPPASAAPRQPDAHPDAVRITDCRGLRRGTEARSGAQQAFAVFLRERHKVVLYEEALEVLEQLAQRYTLGALTNGNADIYKTDAAEYFDFAFLAEDIGASKPHPDMFHAALEHAGVGADRSYTWETTRSTISSGARDVGMHTVWMNSQGEEWPGGDRADREIDNLRQLPEAIASMQSRC